MIDESETKTGSPTETKLKPSLRDQSLEVEPPSMPKWGISLVRNTCYVLSRILYRIKYYNIENVPTEENFPGGLMICANHQSYFDPFWICLPVKRDLRYMAWDKATQWFLVGSFIRALGAFPVKIERAGKESFLISIGWLKGGGSLVLFPEGERALQDGKLLEFKTGAVRIAMQAGVPILPVTIRGANKVWAQGMKLPGFAKVEVIYHPIFRIPEKPANLDHKTHITNVNEQLKQIIASELNK